MKFEKLLYLLTLIGLLQLTATLAPAGAEPTADATFAVS